MRSKEQSLLLAFSSCSLLLATIAAKLEDPMAAKKAKKSRKAVKSLPPKRLSSKHAKSVKGGNPLRVNWKVSE